LRKQCPPGGGSFFALWGGQHPYVNDPMRKERNVKGVGRFYDIRGKQGTKTRQIFTYNCKKNKKQKKGKDRNPSLQRDSEEKKAYGNTQ